MEAYLAVGFPLIAAVILAAFFPISLKDYFASGEIKTLGHGLTPYKFKPRDYLLIFSTYLLSALFLSIVQAYLLWDFSRESRLLYSSRYTDFFMYPVFPSALMALFLMLFVFSYHYARRGEDDVRKFLLRTYDGWPLYKDIPRYKAIAIAAGIACMAANLWFYNMYVNVSEEGIVYSTEESIEPVRLKFEDIWYLQIVQYGDRHVPGSEWYSLWIRMRDRSIYNTDKFLLRRSDSLEDLNRLVRAAEEASGGYMDVITTKRYEPGNVAWGTLLDWDNR